VRATASDRAARRREQRRACARGDSSRIVGGPSIHCDERPWGQRPRGQGRRCFRGGRDGIKTKPSPCERCRAWQKKRRACPCPAYSLLSTDPAVLLTSLHLLSLLSLLLLLLLLAKSARHAAATAAAEACDDAPTDAAAAAAADEAGSPVIHASCSGPWRLQEVGWSFAGFQVRLCPARSPFHWGSNARGTEPSPPAGGQAGRREPKSVGWDKHRGEGVLPLLRSDDATWRRPRHPLPTHGSDRSGSVCPRRVVRLTEMPPGSSSRRRVGSHLSWPLR
jgi:hypothetical protein